MKKNGGVSRSERLDEEKLGGAAGRVVPATVVPKQAQKKSWLPILITSAACFAAGIVTDKYGKQIVNTIVKAIA